MGSGNSRDLFEARLEDAIRRSSAGSVAYIPFLTMRERRRAEHLLNVRGMRGAYWFWGGHYNAEMACLFLLPEYLVAILPADDLERYAILKEYLAEEMADAVMSVSIKGSGFRKLSHRDYLGAVLGLGIERDAIGDIAVQGDHEAILFCPRTIGAFLMAELTKVGSDTVHCRECIIDETFTDGKQYRPISDTVASARLDCVVAALCNLSREAAQCAVRSGLVEVDFESEQRVDVVLEPPITVSVRGYGRFVLRSFDGETRKGRLRLRADQLI
ncbi:MAG: hypothetical protein E7584_05215 [Ruminococcaceae bacterium]|nr:hypothetical protein [Oscillospiraceae bacterium]